MSGQSPDPGLLQGDSRPAGWADGSYAEGFVNPCLWA